MYTKHSILVLFSFFRKVLFYSLLDKKKQTNKSYITSPYKFVSNYQLRGTYYFGENMAVWPKTFGGLIKNNLCRVNFRHLVCDRDGELLVCVPFVTYFDSNSISGTYKLTNRKPSA